MEATLTEVTPEIRTLRNRISSAHSLLQRIGEAAQEKAKEHDWCEEYDELVEQFDEGTEFSNTFVEAARRKKETVEKTFRLTLRFNYSSDDSDYEASADTTDSREGTYRLPADMRVDSIDDLRDNEDVEHIDGEDLVDWYDGTDNITPELEVETDSISEA